MATQSERLSKRPSFFRERRPLYARELHSQPTAAPTETKSTPTLRKYLGLISGKLLTPLGIFFLCSGLWLLRGYVLGKLSPEEYMVTVQPFEILTESDNHNSLSGKSASDIVVDIVNDVASHATQFHGTDYYNIDVGIGAQPVSLHQAIKVPIQTSYGIELQGISVDKILHLYDQVRYAQWTIGGDVVSSPEGLIGRIRLNKSHAAKSWETPPSKEANPTKLVQSATYLMLAEEVPELLGQSYLQQANYGAAEKVFRQWAIRDPQNWKPSYYLSLAYSYQDKAQEASALARWSNNLVTVVHDSNKSSQKRGESAGTGKEIASNLVQTTGVALQTSVTSDAQKLDELQQALNTSGRSQSTLDRLLGRKPANVDSLVQRAKILDKEALAELSRNPSKAYELSKQAIGSLEDAIQRVPENGGLHEQRGILLLNLVTIMRKQAREPHGITDEVDKEAKAYTRALQLRPQKESALWGAVYAQIDLNKNEDAVDLARVITLLQPDSNAASTAYIVALARAIKTPGKEPEREKEVEDCLNRLLKSNPNESQLLAIWDALKVNNDRKGLDIVAAGAKRLFPANATFEERKLQRYFVGNGSIQAQESEAMVDSMTTKGKKLQQIPEHSLSKATNVSENLATSVLREW